MSSLCSVCLCFERYEKDFLIIKGLVSSLIIVYIHSRWNIRFLSEQTFHGMIFVFVICHAHALISCTLNPPLCAWLLSSSAFLLLHRLPLSLPLFPTDLMHSQFTCI